MDAKETRLETYRTSFSQKFVLVRSYLSPFLARQRPSLFPFYTFTILCLAILGPIDFQGRFKPLERASGRIKFWQGLWI